MSNKYQAIASEQYHRMVAFRRHLHANPELAFYEEETSRYVRQALDEIGIPYERCKVGYGIVARILGRGDGKTVGFRADMDALPLQEKNEVEYRSKVEGIMHACGHDGHVAVLLGLASALKAHPELLCGDVVLFFQPAEERLPGGAVDMVEEGWTEGLDSVFAIHFHGATPTGSVLTMPGAIMAYSDSVAIEISGKGGHAADPNLTRDALLAASHAVCALQNIISRFINPIDNAVLSVCSLRSGNGVFNVIQEKAEILGTVRSFSPVVRKTIEEKIHQVLAGVCAIFGTSYELDYRYGYPAVVNDPVRTELAVAAVEAAGYHCTVCKPDLGGEDFAYFLEKVPGCFLYVGCANKEKGICSPVHTGTFDIDDEALLAALAVELAIYERAARI